MITAHVAGMPVEELLNYLRQVQEVLKRHEATASFLVHAGTGQVHTRPFLDLLTEYGSPWACDERAPAPTRRPEEG